MNNIVPEEYVNSAGQMRKYLVKYSEVEMLIKLGEYKSGGDADTDEAVSKIDAVNAFLKQHTHEQAPFDDTIAQLKQLSQ